MNFVECRIKNLCLAWRGRAEFSKDREVMKNKSPFWSDSHHLEKIYQMCLFLEIFEIFLKQDHLSLTKEYFYPHVLGYLKLKKDQKYLRMNSNFQRWLF